MITSYKRGHPIVFLRGKWVYADTKTSASVERPCVRCGRLPTLDGYDACLGRIDGVVSACCGHGVEPAYIVKARKENAK